MPDNICEKCRYLGKDIVGNHECHRLPPTAHGFPNVNPEHDWCAEFKPIDE